MSDKKSPEGTTSKISHLIYVKTTLKDLSKDKSKLKKEQLNLKRCKDNPANS